jgi:putative DNA primase/helicase
MMADVIDLQAWKGKLQMGRGGPVKNLTNLMHYLRNLPGLGAAIRYNEFAGRVEWRGKPLQDEDAIDIRLILEAAGFEPNTSDVIPALIRHAHDNSFDPVREYLDGLKWDKTPRLDGWLQTYMGAPAHEILSVFGAKFMIGAVARVYQPGCQMDNALVLEGKQGIRKTTAVATLFGRDLMISSISDFKTKEASIALQGRWVIEIAELSALKKTDINDVKKFITETVDQYRPPFGRGILDRPRRCVMIGTTNENKYLQDQTGNRRFWPVPCTKADIEGLTRDRDQLWAEAVARYTSNEAWWITDEAILAKAEVVQADRALHDPWEDMIDAWLLENPGVDFVTSARLLTDAIRMEGSRQTRADEMRISDIMTGKGWAHERRIPMPGQRRKWGFAKP